MDPIEASDKMVFTYSETLKTKKQFFVELLENYQPLLADISVNGSAEGQESGSNKESLKQIFMEGGLLGSKIKTDKLKLSDFIDESFFDDIDEVSQNSVQVKTRAQHGVKDIITEIKKAIGEPLMQEAHPFKAKRVNMGKSDSEKPTMVAMSPLLAILVQALNKDVMVDNDWKVRQSAASTVRAALQMAKVTPLEYYLVGGDQELRLLETKTVALDQVLRSLLPSIFIVLVKDHFNDFEELKVITPVREEAILLLQSIIESGLCQDETTALVQSLPNLLKAIDEHAHDTWISRYNFFLLLKGLFSVKSKVSMRQTVFAMFNRVLVESLLHIEDEVRIIVTEILNIVLPQIIESKKKNSSLQYLLKNLQKNLKQSDEIESSAIPVFALINRIIDETQDLEALGFSFDLNVFCPFNFHKIANVRYSYLQILNKCLSTGSPIEDMPILIRLTLQSLAMERSKPIVKMNLENLRLLVSRLSVDDMTQLIDTFFTDQSLPFLIYSQQIQQFESFVFFESQNFESIDRDYYRVVFRPVSPEELQQFYLGKIQSMTRAVAILMGHSGDICGRLMGYMESYMMPPESLTPGLQPPVHDAHLIYLLAVCRLVQSGRFDVIDTTYIGTVTNSFLSPTFSETLISVDHFKDQPRLQALMQILHENLSRNPAYIEQITLLQPFYQMFERCYYEHTLVEIAPIQQCVEQTLAPAFEPLQETCPEVYECFKEMRSLIAQLVDYASVTCARVKQVSATIHLCLVAAGHQPLAALLNNLIKPVLNQSKKESAVFLQTLACKTVVKLVESLISLGKSKPALQVAQLLVKDVEVYGSGNVVQDRGIQVIFKHVMKGSKINVLTGALNGYLMTYLQGTVSEENGASFTKVLLYILDYIWMFQSEDAEGIYQQQIGVMLQQLCHLLTMPSTNDLPLAVGRFFLLFQAAQQSLISAVLKASKSQNRVGFETLTRLLDQVQDEQAGIVNTNGRAQAFLQFIPVFIIPVIQNIQCSRLIFGNDKQITLILAQLLSLLPLNLASLQQKKQVAIAEEEKVDTSSANGHVLLGGELEAQAQEGFNFLQVFVNNQMGAESYQIQIPVKATLRDYQRQGVTWLASLGHYNLNCALCDDMGLGKTLQSLCVVLNESYLRRQQGQHSLNVIVCPTTITYNWKAEINKYFDGIRIGIYEGSSQQKNDTISNSKNLDVIIVSYEKLRNDVKQFAGLNIFYLILDEAHIIKNAKAKITQAVKSLHCQKKIVLTGTPLQNKVSELWSIFDFLMPGFLEEEGIFNKKYNQYLTTNIKKLSEKLEETQNFVNALKSLKKRIQPFILRRTKDQVLKELPPKIIQDVICKMTTFQEYVHGVVEKNYPITQTLNQSAPVDQGAIKQAKKQGHQVLQSLIKHRKVCNHPYFVVDEFRAKDKSIQKYFSNKTEDEQMSYEHSGKLLGLVDKLMECEIIERLGTDKEEAKQSEIHAGDGSLFTDLAQASINLQETAGKSSGHRALIFCQMGTFMKMIVDQVLVKFNVTFIQLLSSHSSEERQNIVDKFNSDESIKVLILTTSVGGLGLTLTGADTVIFAEHDWNPMKDLQAIDRAHRIGQTKQVCVYRLIVQDTLEEKIMNLQRFKENLARSLVQSRDTSVENANNMELTDLLNSFQEHSAFTQRDDNMKKKQAALGVEDKIVSNIEQIWQSKDFEVEDL